MTQRLAGPLAGLSLALAASTASAQQAVGDWLGPLAVSSDITLQTAVHIHKDAAGAETGTFDSLDEGLYGLPLTALVDTGGALTFSVARLHATYAGKWDPAAHQWTGKWSQNGGSLPLILTSGQVPDAPVVAGLDGDWDGALTVGPGVKLRLSLRVETGPHGTRARLLSIDQDSVTGISSLSHTGDKVRVELRVLGAAFDAALDPKGQTLTGIWTQSGQDLPLVLTRRAAGQAKGGDASATDASETLSPPRGGAGVR